MQHSICRPNKKLTSGKNVWPYSRYLLKIQIKPVSRHFPRKGHDVNDAKIVIIQLMQHDTNIRLQTEETWIRRLKTRSPMGLNLIQLWIMRQNL